MLRDLPSNLQTQVKNYLATGKFYEAKQIHDNWINVKQSGAATLS